MQYLATSLALLSAAALSDANPLLANRAVCNADNCARAVSGSAARPAATIRSADCSSFLEATVTPAPVTAFTTVTSVVTATTVFVGDAANPGGVGKRADDASKAVPTYASACSGSARYSSACSCFGVTANTVTATPTTTTATVTVTSLATASVFPGSRPVCGSTLQGQGACECTYTVNCNSFITGGTLIKELNTISELDCVNAADNYDNAFDLDYNRVSGVCRIFQRAAGTEVVEDDDAYSFAGTCNTSGGAPGCVVG